MNVTFYVLFLVFSLAAVPLFTLMVVVQAPFISHRTAMKRFRMAVRWYGWVAIHVLSWPLLRVEYRDTEKTARGPFLVICNHRSASDPFLVACLPFELVQIVNVWPFRIPVLGFFAKAAGYINIRAMPIEAFYAKALKFLDEGVSIVSFPEGTRSGSRQMGQFRGSIFRLALMAKVPLVPMCISGNENTPHRGSLVLHPGVIKVRTLRAIPWDEYKNDTPLQLKRRVRDLIAAELAGLDRT